MLAGQKLRTNYLAGVSDGNRFFFVRTPDSGDPMSQGRGINNECNLLLRKHL